MLNAEFRNMNLGLALMDDLLYLLVVLFCGCIIIAVLKFWSKRQAKLNPETKLYSETKKPKPNRQIQHPNDPQQDLDRLFVEWDEFNDDEEQLQQEEDANGW